MTGKRGPTWPASSRIGESRADFEARIARDGWPGACAEHLVIGCECQGPPVPEPEPKRGRGRPRVGAPVIVRLHPFQRAQIESAAREGEALAATIRRLIGEALAARQLTKDR